MLAGIVIGGFLGQLLVNFSNSNGVKFLDWLTYGIKLGIYEPKLFSLDLDIVSIVFGITIKFTVAGVIGMTAAIFIYRRLWR
jgi:hypothetical protein